MPKLDGYGLLQRIRASRISRIRLMPVIVISGSDAQEERDRAKAAGATELITKGIATAQLLSRLDTLSQLVSTQQDFERSLEILVQGVPAAADTLMASAAMFAAAADAMLNFAVRHQRSFVLLHICVALRDAPDDAHAAPDPRVVDAIGGLLRHTIRQTDCVARVGRAEFTLATNGINPAAAQGFAQRVCGAIANAKLPEQDAQTLIASCGLAYVTGDENAAPRLDALRETAQRRARLGLQRRIPGVVGAVDDAEPGV
jgi:PleD family two-component response regulator